MKKRVEINTPPSSFKEKGVVATVLERGDPELRRGLKSGVYDKGIEASSRRLVIMGGLKRGETPQGNWQKEGGGGTYLKLRESTLRV